MTNRTESGRLPRGMELLLFCTAILWAAAARAIAGLAASGIAQRLRLTYAQMLLQSVFLLFLVVVGFRTLDWIARRGEGSDEVLPLPIRNTWAREWGTGVALGWGLCLLAVFPVLLVGDFHATLNRGIGVAPGILASVLTLLILCLAEEAIFRGYPFQRLVRGLSPGWASAVSSVLFAAALVSANPPANRALGLLDATLFGVVLTTAYLRTHALWLGWGLHFGYRVVMGVVLGLPLLGRNDFGSLMDGNLGGPLWFSGGFYGLDAVLLTAVVMLAGLVMLYRVTRDWAWSYTLPEIVSAGYEVVVAPPAAHLAMEKAAAPPPLVQILATTPQSFSVQPRPDEPQPAEPN